MINQFKEWYIKQQFYPTVGALFVNPFYFARRGLYKQIAEISARLEGNLLDVGCGTKPYRSLFNVDSYVGLDIDSEHTRALAIADYYYEGDRFPFADNSFDSVITNQVLEHVFNPEVFLSEIARVLKPGGKMLLTVPFAWDEHEQPYDYARYSSYGLRHLLQQHGFDIIDHRKTSADISVVFQLLNAYLYKLMKNKPRFFLYLMVLVVCSTVNILGVVLSKLLPKNEDLYLDNIVLAERNNELL